MDYKDLIERPAEMAEAVNAFIGGRADLSEMASSVDSTLYRNRNPSNAGRAS